MMTIQPLKPHGCGERDYQVVQKINTLRFIPTLSEEVAQFARA
jgi:hypothetical protein